MKKISPSLKKLVKILNDGGIHSGTELGHALQISRNAVWKHIQQLDDYDIAVETVQSKGYRLEKPLVMLDSRAIKKYLPKSLEVKLELLGSIASTNDYVKLHSKQYSWFCLAEHQSAGKGRFGRQWYSPFAANIYLTYSWLINKDVSELSGLSLVVSLAIVAALEAYGVENLSIKWPNDIYWQEQKLAGVLIEMIAESHGLTQVIIGIGLNANMPTVKDKNMKRSWTSLDQILNNYQDRNLIVAHLISHLCQSLQQFINAGLSSFTEQWQRYDYLQGKTITLSNSNQQISGKMRGINASGHLMLQVGNTLHTCSAGDTTLKT